MGRIIAVTGKGGCGKTTLVALLLSHLVRQRRYRLLVIDADSAISLPYALGMDVPRTVAQLREGIIEDPQVRSQAMDRHIRDSIRDILAPGDGFDLLVMGRPEGPGCFCQVNDLLRYGIESLSAEYDLALIDGEAGPEQLHRRVVASLDTLIVVSDPSLRGLRTAQVVRQAAEKSAARPPAVVLVVNRWREGAGALLETAAQMGFAPVAVVPEDPEIARRDRLGSPLSSLPDSSPAAAAVGRLAGEMGLAG